MAKQKTTTASSVYDNNYINLFTGTIAQHRQAQINLLKNKITASQNLDYMKQYEERHTAVANSLNKKSGRTISDEDLSEILDNSLSNTKYIGDILNQASSDATNDSSMTKTKQDYKVAELLTEMNKIVSSKQTDEDTFNEFLNLLKDFYSVSAGSQKTILNKVARDITRQMGKAKITSRSSYINGDTVQQKVVQAIMGKYSGKAIRVKDTDKMPSSLERLALLIKNIEGFKDGASVIQKVYRSGGRTVTANGNNDSQIRANIMEHLYLQCLAQNKTAREIAVCNAIALKEGTVSVGFQNSLKECELNVAHSGQKSVSVTTKLDSTFEEWAKKYNQNDLFVKNTAGKPDVSIEILKDGTVISHVGVSVKDYDVFYNPNLDEATIEIQHGTSLLVLLTREMGINQTELMALINILSSRKNPTRHTAYDPDQTTDFTLLWENYKKSIAKRSLVSALMGMVDVGKSDQQDIALYIVLGDRIMRMSTLIQHIIDYGSYATITTNEANSYMNADDKYLNRDTYVTQNINDMKYQQGSNEKNAKARSDKYTEDALAILRAAKVRINLNIKELRKLMK